MLDRKQGLWSVYRVHDDLPAWVNTMLETTFADNARYLRPYLKNNELEDGHSD